jgi:hypothetical protein
MSNLNPSQRTCMEGFVSKVQYREYLIEDQAVSPPYDLAPSPFPLPPPPLSGKQVLSFLVCRPSSLLTGEGGKEEEVAKSRQRQRDSLVLHNPVYFVGSSVGGCTLFCWECRSACSFIVAVTKCMQSCYSAKVYALCSLVVVPKCMHYAVLL